MAAPTAYDWTAVAKLVDNFESSRRNSPRTSLAEFLPHATHPLRNEVAAELVRVDLEYSWTNGKRKSLDEYRTVVPELFAVPSLLVGPAFEEYRLRRIAGERVSAGEYAKHFGVITDDWPEIEPVADRVDAFGPGHANLAFPQPGEQFAGFNLISVIGRGAFATVFLAEQNDLAGRNVVLKISERRTFEPQFLARVQHTNIVPIFSVHESQGLFAVCMPYFGETTLADLITDSTTSKPLVGSRPGNTSTLAGAREDTLVDERSRSNHDASEASPAANETSAAPLAVDTSHVDAALKLAAGIAAGLDHAHQRGIIHRDVKPANVLVTAEGSPLLLDFNLSDELVANGRESLEVGGTLPYMAPEHLRAVCDGSSVDHRSDQFSLGVILYQLLAGRRPYPVRSGNLDDTLEAMIGDRMVRPPSIRQYNSAVPPSIDALVHKCLAANPDERYPSVAALGEDVQRHLQDLPLKYAANPSVTERIGKWRRRHPRLMSAGSLVGVTFVLAAVFTALWVMRGRYVATLEAAQAYAQFVDEMPAIRMALSLPETDTAMIAAGLREFARATRPYGVTDADTRRDLPHYANLPAADRAQLNEQLLELSYLAARGEKLLSLRTPDKSAAKVHLERALQYIQAAIERVSAGGASKEILAQHAALLQALGRPNNDPQRDHVAVKSQVDDYLTIQRLLVNHDYVRAETLLLSLLTQRATDPVVWLLLGNVKAARGNLSQADVYYTAAVSLCPNSHVAKYNRAQCRADRRDFLGALADYEDVSRAWPQSTCVRLNRAMAYEAAGDLPRAIVDLDRVLDKEDVPPRAFLVRSRIRTQLGDTVGAESDRNEGLKRTPQDEMDWIARGVARLKDDPDGALQDFRRALELNPASRLALKNIVHVSSDRLSMNDAALEALNQWLALEPENAQALIGRAVLNARLGLREQARADLDAALAESQEATILFQAACTLSLLSGQDNDDAARGLLMLTRAFELDPRLIQRAQTDGDLQSLRAMSEFASITESTAAMLAVRQKLQIALRESAE